MRTIKRSEANPRPVTADTPDDVLYCAYCGRATTKTEALLRKFNTGYSGCCNDNLTTTGFRGTIIPPSPITIIED